MIRTTIAKFFLLSQALCFITDLNGFSLNDYSQREKRDLISLLRGTDSLVSDSDVNPLEVIPIPLKMEFNSENLEKDSLEEEKDSYKEEQANDQEDNQNFEQILDELKTPQSDINGENFDQKLNDLKLMYETAISNLRTETVGAQTYIQKKTTLAEKHLENIFKSVELMVNNRVDLSFHSIETKMNEAQKVLGTLNNLILRNLETKLKSIESDLLDQVKEEKSEMENKMNLFSQRVEILSEKLTELLADRTNLNMNRSENQTNSTNSTDELTTTDSIGNNYSSNDIAELENVSEEDLDEQTEEMYEIENPTEYESIENEEFDEDLENIEGNLENEIDTTDNIEYEESDQVFEENQDNTIDSKFLLRAMIQPASEYDYEEYSIPSVNHDYQDFLESHSNSAFDYYHGNHPRQFEYAMDYRYY